MKYTAHMIQVNDVIGINVILPLAIGVLWHAAQSDPEVKSKWQLGEKVYRHIDDSTIQKISQGDLVCFSTYVWNSVYHHSLAAKIKQLNPDIFIVFGGPNITPDRKDFWERANGNVDLALVGEGEASFSQLLKQWPDLDTTVIPGAWTPDHWNGFAPRIHNLNDYESPYLNGFYDDIIDREIRTGLIIQAVIQTNRGCPYHCSFCEEGKDYKNKMHWFDLTRLRKEIEYLAQKSVSFLSMADDNWGIDDRDVDLMSWIIHCKKTQGYPEVMDATFAKNAPDRVLEICRRDREAGTNLIRGVTVALQSLNDRTLTGIQRFNLIPQKQARLITGLKKLEIPTYTEMIWPLPYETYNTFLHGIENVISLGLNNWLGVYPLSLHPGTQLYEDFSDQYQIVEQISENQAVGQVRETVNIVHSSAWVNNDTLVQGQVFYTWITALYFFGFVRNSLQQISRNRSIKIVDLVSGAINFTKQHTNSRLYSMNHRLETWWREWSCGNTPLDLSIFPDKDTRHWSPYTHLGSWIQANIDDFYNEWSQYLETLEARQMIDLDKDSVVRYGKSYPYHTQQGTVSIRHSAPDFNNLFEFSRYYYWWKRKNGWHRTAINKEQI